jgi:hypothetical protein
MRSRDGISATASNGAFPRASQTVILARDILDCKTIVGSTWFNLCCRECPVARWCSCDTYNFDDARTNCLWCGKTLRREGPSPPAGSTASIIRANHPKPSEDQFVRLLDGSHVPRRPAGTADSSNGGASDVTPSTEHRGRYRKDSPARRTQPASTKRKPTIDSILAPDPGSRTMIRAASSLYGPVIQLQITLNFSSFSVVDKSLLMSPEQMTTSNLLYEHYGNLGHRAVNHIGHDAVLLESNVEDGSVSTAQVSGGCFDAHGQLGRFRFIIASVDGAFAWSGRSWRQAEPVEPYPLRSPRSEEQDARAPLASRRFTDWKSCVGDAVARLVQSIEQPRWRFTLVSEVGSVKAMPMMESETFNWDPLCSGAERDLGDIFNRYMSNLQRIGWEVGARQLDGPWFERPLRARMRK